MVVSGQKTEWSSSDEKSIFVIPFISINVGILIKIHF